MSVLIAGMKRPTSCSNCQFCMVPTADGRCWCAARQGKWDGDLSDVCTGISEHCPLLGIVWTDDVEVEI